MKSECLLHLLRGERIGKEKRLRLLTRLIIGLCVLLLVYIIGRALIPVRAPAAWTAVYVHSMAPP